MKLNPQQREQLRLSLLRFLNDTPRFARPVALLLQMARAEGRPALDAETVELEMEYLAGKKLVLESSKTLSPEVRSWKISVEGRDFLAQQGQDNE